MLIIWLKAGGFLELEKFGESANPCATETVLSITLQSSSLFVCFTQASVSFVDICGLIEFLIEAFLLHYFV